MPNFIATCVDRKDQVQLRADARSEHLVYIEGAADEILLVGPLLDEDDRIIGSLYMVEAENLASARAFVDADPFTRAGLFETIDVRRFRMHLGILMKR